MKTIILLCSILFLNSVFAQEQTIVNFGNSTHPFQILNIKHNSTETSIKLVLTNQIDGGYFCADKKIYLSNAHQGYEAILKRAEGIPSCPEVYRFQKAGEKLVFTLIFDKIPESLTHFDLVEACNENCFRVSGIIADETLNNSINESYALFAANKVKEALALTEKIVKENPNYPYAFLQFNLIHYAANSGDIPLAKVYYQELKTKKYRDKRNTISRLQAMEYFSQIM